MSTDDWKRVIGQAADLGCRQIQFIGGEPTIHPDLEELISYSYSREMQFIEVYTNATTLNQRRVSFMKDHGVRIATSFYSCNEQTHDEITQNRGSFKKTMIGIDNTIKAGLHLRVGVVLMDKNAPDRDATMNFLRDKGVKDIGEDKLRNVGRGGVVHFKLDSDPYAELCGQCWKGRACVTTNGNTYPCVFSRAFLIGNALDTSLSEIVGSRTLIHFRETQRSRVTPVAQCSPECNPGALCTPSTGSCNPTCNPGQSPCNPQVCNPYQSCGPTR